jgi:hypothetical protein
MHHSAAISRFHPSHGVARQPLQSLAPSLFSISISLAWQRSSHGLFRASLTQAIDDQARSLLGADLVVGSRPFTDKQGGGHPFVERNQARDCVSDHGALSEGQARGWSPSARSAATSLSTAK